MVVHLVGYDNWDWEWSEWSKKGGRKSKMFVRINFLRQKRK